MLRLLSTMVLLACGMNAGEWIKIQPDASFKGWTRVPIPPEAPLDAVSQWSISTKDGDVICDGAKEKGHEWLRYDRELHDFILRAEWRFRKIEGETKYNSGIFTRNSENGDVWYQAQVGAPANAGYFFYQTVEKGEKKRGNLKAEMKEQAVKEAGEWNLYEIRAEGPKVTLTVNGKLTSELECDRLSGYVGLEAEHYRIEFRNLQLKELP